MQVGRQGIQKGKPPDSLHKIGDDFAQHFEGDHEHKHREALFQCGDGQGVGRFCAQRGEGHACAHDAGEGGQVDIADAVGRQAGRVPADEDEPGRADQCDKGADCGGGGDGAVDGHVAHRHEDDVLHPSPYAHQRGEARIQRGDSAEPRLARHMLENMRLLAAQEHVKREADLAGGEDDFEVLGFENMGEPRSEQNADEHAGQKALQERDIDRAAFMVRECRGDAREDDGEQRCADRYVHGGVLIAEMREDIIQARNEDCAAANAQKARREAGENAKDDQEQGGEGEFHLLLPFIGDIEDVQSFLDGDEEVEANANGGV